MAITDVQGDNSTIIVYGENGRELSRMGGYGKVVGGVTTTFFVVSEANVGTIIVYDENCREISRMGGHSKEIRGGRRNYVHG